MSNDLYDLQHGESLFAGWAGSNGPGPQPPVVQGAFRTTRNRLFQGPNQLVRPPTYGAAGYTAGAWGPTYRYVDVTCGWPWVKPGGDWIDINEQPQGAALMGLVSVNQTTGLNTRSYEWNVTDLFQKIEELDVPAALRMSRASGSGTRGIPNLFSTVSPPPSVSVTYQDGSTATLQCRMIAGINSGTGSPLFDQLYTNLPCFLEFDRPDRPVASATCRMDFNNHGSTNNYVAGFGIVRPAMPFNPVDISGTVAQEAGDYDEGLMARPGVLGIQLYPDGSVFGDYFDEYSGNYNREDQWSPEFWDEGATPDLTKLPHRLQGKWHGTTDDRIGLVPSSYEGEGFQPLAPGLGAMRIHMPQSDLPAGSEIGDSATLACDCRLYLPPEEMGVLDDIYIRQYVRLQTPMVPTPSDRWEFLNKGASSWADLGGKILVSPFHPYFYPTGSGNISQNSGGAGGNKGSQMRNSWKLCDEANGGGSETGFALGFHLYDFLNFQPAGYVYSNDSGDRSQWGQIGGIGGAIYPGFWYCIETRMKYNSVDVENPNDPGKWYTPDGILEAWINGRLVYRRTGMVFRVLPRWDRPRLASSTRPMRALGHVGLWHNWYHGGKVRNSFPMTMFIAGLAWGKRRIGPMKGVVL